MQVQACAFDNVPASGVSLFSDAAATECALPSTLSQTLKAHSDEVWTLAFNSAGTLLASGSKDATLLLWERVGVTLTLRRRLFGHAMPLFFVKWQPAGSLLLSATQHAVLVHHADTGHVVCEIPAARCVHVTLDGINERMIA